MLITVARTGLLTVVSDMCIDYSNILILDIPSYKVFASPNLNIKQDGYKLNVSGEINIPNANLTPHDFTKTIELPDDIVYINKRANQNKSKWEINSNLKLTLCIRAKGVCAEPDSSHSKFSFLSNNCNVPIVIGRT